MRAILACGLGAMLVLGSCARTPEDTTFAPVAREKIAGDPSTPSVAKPRPMVDARSRPRSTEPSKPLPSGHSAEAKHPPRPAVGPTGPSPALKQPSIEVPPATYRDIATAYNQRTARLQRVWGRAVVSVEYTDDEGRRRRDQGEGHLQVIQPSRMALSAGKLSETILWIGCDADRYWFIDAKETHRAWVGRHSEVSRQKVEALGMPAPPRDLLALAGITPLPAPAIDGRRDPAVRWGAERKVLVFEVTKSGARWRYTVDPRTYEPSRIEVLDPATSEPILSATLERYEGVKILGEGLVPPRLASRMRCLHYPSGSMLGLSLANMVNGGNEKFPDEIFRFEALRDRLGVREVVDADAPRPASAESAGAME